MAGPLDIAQYVQGQFNAGRQRRDRNRLAELASQAYGADPTGQRAAVGQAIGIDPQAGFALGQNLGHDRNARVQGLSQRARMLVAYKEAGNDAAVASLYPQLAAEARAVGLAAEIPDQWDDAFLPGIQQLAQIADGAGTTPAGLREFQGMTQGLDPDDVMKARRIALGLDPRPSSAAIGYREVTGPDGRKILVATDPRAIGATTIGGGPSFGSFAGEPQQPAPPGSYANPVPNGQQYVNETTTLATEMAAAGIPDEQIVAFINGRLNPQASSAGGMEPQGGVMPPQAGSVAPQADSLPPRLDPVNGGHVNPFSSRTPEEQAALTEAAKQQAQLAYLPQELAIRGQAAIDQKAGEAGITADAKAATEQAERDATFALYETAMQGLQAGLTGTTTGPIVGRLPAFTADQQKAEGGVAAMAPILKQLFRAAGEGTFTDKDQELLLDMVPTRTDRPEAIAFKLQNIDNIVRAKLRAAPRNSEPPQPRRLRFNPATGRIE